MKTFRLYNTIERFDTAPAIAFPRKPWEGFEKTMIFFINRLFVYAWAFQTKPDILLLVYSHLSKQAEEFCTCFISLSGSGMLLCLTPVTDLLAVTDKR